MTVLFYCFSGSGGGFTNIVLLVEIFARQYPHDRIIVICDERTALIELEELDNVKIIQVPICCHPEITRLRLGYFGLRRYVREIKPDVFWSVNMGSYGELGIPQVIMMNNLFQVDAWSNVAKRHPRGSVFLALLRYFFRKSLCRSSALIVQTELMKQRAQQVCGCPTHVYVVSKAVETTQDYSFSHLPQELETMLGSDRQCPAFTFLYVADESTHKNHSVLFLALDRIRSSGHPVRLAVTLAAKDAISLGGQSARSLMKSGHLLPLGWVRKEHLHAVYEACDACVVPSLLESQSSAHLEAMQWGKPLISADLPYARDLCAEASLYADPHDPDEWVERMIELSASMESRVGLVCAGKRQMEKHPKNWAEVAQQFHSILEESVLGYEEKKKAV